MTLANAHKESERNFFMEFPGPSLTLLLTLFDPYS